MHRIAVIGGAGTTGQCVVDYAIEKSLSVRMLYRTKETVPQRFWSAAGVELIQGNVLNMKDCKRVVEGVDGVCIVLGTRNSLAPTTELSTGTANLIAAMKEANVRRFSIVMSSFLFCEDDKVMPGYRDINAEHRRMLDLTKSSGLEYVAILPPRIVDEPSTDFTVLRDASPGHIVSKYDLAHFIVDSLEKKEHYGAICGICKKSESKVTSD